MYRSEVERLPVPEHLQAQAYRYRRFRRWIDLLMLRFGYTESQLAERLRTTEDVIRGIGQPKDVHELSRLWHAAGKLVELPAVWEQRVANGPTPPIFSDVRESVSTDQYNGHSVLRKQRGDVPGKGSSRRYQRRRPVPEWTGPGM